MRRVLKTLIAASFAMPIAALAGPTDECSVESSSQVETGACLGAVKERSEAALAVALGVAQSQAAELDEVTGRDVAVPALARAQEAWLVYRDASCEHAGALFGGGSGTGIAIVDCQIRLTRQRTDVLFGAAR